MLSTTAFRRACYAVALTCLALVGTSAIGSHKRYPHAEPAGEHEGLKATPKASSGSCGVERWSVKVGTDPDASLVNINATTSQSITYLRGITAPVSPPLNARVQPTEITNFVVNATLVEYKLENDSDYHMVIKDAAGNTMIAELVDPACVSGGPFKSLITSARATFDAKYTASSSFKTANVPVQLTGVAFFDFQHGQTGVAPNGIELHPVLKINFNPTTTPDFSLTAAPSTVSAVQGGSTSSTVTVVPVNGYNSTVTFAAAGLPSGVTASFSPASSTGSTTLTLKASASAAVGTATVSIGGSDGTISHTTSVSLTVNPSGGVPDFGLSVSPSSATLAQGTNTSATVSVTPTNGFNSTVSYSASGLPSGVTATFNPTSSLTGSTVTLAASATAATGTSTVTITGTGPTMSHTSALSLTVNPSGSGTTAIYNATLKAPGCSTVGVSCDSGTLLVGRGTMISGVEPNHPNTINASCADGNSGTFHSDESNDRIVISSVDGGPLTAGNVARITATVWAYSTTANFLDLYSAPNANTPVWTFLNTITPSGTGAQTLTTTFTLPAGGLQAIRAHFRSGGSASSCSTGAYDESDDLLFAVSSTGPSPDFSLGASPAAVSMNPGASATSTITVGSLNGYNSGTSLSASGLSSGLTAVLSPVAVTPVAGGSATSTLTLTASSSMAAGTYNVTVNGASGSLSHTTPLTATITVSGGTTQLLGNPGFETGTASPWTMSSGALCSNSSCSGEVARSGTWFAWLNGYGSAHTDTLSQTVTIPAGKTSAMLQFYMHIDTLETSTTAANDKLTVAVYSTTGTLLGTLNTYSNLNANTGYSVHNLAMTPYLGQTVVVKFTGSENTSLQTSFVIDDVNLNVQ